MVDRRVRSRALFIGEVDSFEDLEQLVERYHVRAAVIDALPEQRLATEFAERRPHYARVGLAYYGRTDPGHDLIWENQVDVWRMNRTQALDEMFHSFLTEAAELPQSARLLGGRVRDGLGEYYRHMMALKRTLEQNSMGNWVARYDDARKADHFAHAEAYCTLALDWGEPWLIA